MAQDELGKLLVVKAPLGVVSLERLPTKYVSYMVYRDGVCLGQIAQIRKWGVNLRYGGWKTRAEVVEQLMKWPSPGHDVATETEADEHARWLGHQAFLRGGVANPFDAKSRPKSRAAWQAAFSTGAAQANQAKQADKQPDNWPFQKWTGTQQQGPKA
jgi:hypothetical protein